MSLRELVNGSLRNAPEIQNSLRAEKRETGSTEHLSLAVCDTSDSQPHFKR